MENRRRKNSSGDKFSFPIIAVRDSDPDEFEFGCVTKPGSPNSDRLFFNGKLLPHVFPLNHPANNFSYSRSTSRTSSISSKDSLMSSRSNSTNSRSSNCSSARTSTSETSERKILSTGGKFPGKKPALNPQYKYSSSQRWQFIAPAPAFMHQDSRSRSRSVKVESKLLKSRKMEKDTTDHEKSWIGKKVLRSFVSACKKCHAIETS
ncbi:uncharacterized protein LOC111396459 [Olea europaea var. sylvestris]|uniref:uncharacterized protein LOC111396459 n=1 Tax=Olea europaea var. sylvestris TaxID=158386 RepID=UPI000C1D0F28|nr:uncharacterized protein LOC111396459 [Olea europaea var. sylvestris]